ncbi:MAG: DUF5398 family protein [Chlamydiia bacterium]|nr:DUF5398 family protein [Chlamydiia bacterium]MCP5492514.1 DUF5398 family protein [Chlamydiales bacterium]
MYGLEKQPSDGFEFDLEKEVKASPERKKEVLKLAEDTAKGLKEAIRDADPHSKEFEKFGKLLHGCIAMQTVIQRVR